MSRRTGRPATTKSTSYRTSRLPTGISGGDGRRRAGASRLPRTRTGTAPTPSSQSGGGGPRSARRTPRSTEGRTSRPGKATCSWATATRVASTGCTWSRRTTIRSHPAVVGRSVTFDASASRDPDGNVVAYAWDFGDSTTGSGAITTHPYAIPGTFNVTLNVTDNDSLNGTVSHDVVVQAAPPGPQPPVADFTANPVRVNPGVPMTFDASD